MKTFKSCMWLLVMLLLPMMVEASVVFDESTPGLTFVYASANPDTGVTAIIFGPGGSASANLALTPGVTYSIAASRKVLTNNQLSFSLDLNGTNYWWDGAWTPSAPDTFQSANYLGYYKPTVATTNVKIYNGGGWAARVDYLSFTPNIFFDETTADLVAAGGSGFGHTDSTMPPGVTNNMLSLGVGTFSGTANLAVGVQYNVYASRLVHSTGNLGFDISLGGSFFAHDSALSTDMYGNDAYGEALIGQYTATSAATNVLLSNGGPWAARADYLRFEAIPEPATIALLGLGFAVLRRRK